MKRHVRKRKRHSSAQRGGSWLGGVLRQGRDQKPRTSHYEVAVPVLGREADRGRLPARLLSACLLAIAVWLLFWFSSDDMFYIQGIRVEGDERLPETELTAISGLEGVNIFWADTHTAAQAIEGLPDVASARVHCSLPANCVVHLIERQPLFVWLQGDAKAWIGADGTVLPARGDMAEAIVLDASGSTALKPGDRVDPELVTAVADLQRLQQDVQTYTYSDQFGLSFRNAQGWLVRLGKGPDMEIRLRVLDALSKHLTGLGIVPTFVDVRFPEAPYFRE